MDWSNEIILNFLKLYERERAIWDPRNINHKNRVAVTQGWLRIQKAFKDQNVFCTVKDLKKKKESLMATFRHLSSKSKTKNAGDEPYKPSWFAYDAMNSFLSGIYTPKSASHPYESGENFSFLPEEAEGAESNASEGVADSKIQSNANEEFEKPPSDPVPTSTYKAPEKRLAKRKKPTTGTPKQKPFLPRNIYDDGGRHECRLFVDLLAEKLRRFDEATRAILMHDIDNLVFQARLKQFDSSYETNAHYQTAMDSDNLFDHVTTEAAADERKSKIGRRNETATVWCDYSQQSSPDESDSAVVAQQSQASPNWSESSMEFSETQIKSLKTETGVID